MGMDFPVSSKPSRGSVAATRNTGSTVKRHPKNERRHHPRTSTVNLVAYACFDADGQRIHQGMGRTVNVSQSGLLLESHGCLDAERIDLHAVDVKNRPIEVTGRIVYSKPGKKGTFLTGIVFTGDRETQIRMVSNLVKLFARQKNRTCKRLQSGKSKNPMCSDID